MQYPRIVKTPSLTQVFADSQRWNSQNWIARVNEVFGGTISKHVLFAFPDRHHICTVNPVECQVLEELTNILNTSRNYWKFWTVELVEKAIPNLVNACIWRNNILTEQSYFRDIVHRYAEEGLELLEGLSDYLLLYSNDRKPSTRKALVRKYLEPPFQEGDARAVLIRALRCFITYRISKKPKGELVFKFTPDLRLSLWGRTINKYLYEQLCLFIYLFRNPEEAHFFIEHRQQLINFVAARLPEGHLDLAEVIVGETFDYLIRRRDCYSENQDSIWIDTSLDTYFIGNILASKRIQRFWEKRRRLEAYHNQEDADGVDDYLDDRITARPKFHEVTERYEPISLPSERDRLLRKYISKLDTTCKTYFNWEYFGSRTECGEPLNQTDLRTISSPCLAKLKDLLVTSGYYDLFVK